MNFSMPCPGISPRSKSAPHFTLGIDIEVLGCYQDLYGKYHAIISEYFSLNLEIKIARIILYGK
jgi:hypothetical protein